MILAVTSRGETLESPVDLRFGQAPHFVIVDSETGRHKAVSNRQDLGAASGAGVQAGQRVADLGANALITGNIGPKAFKVLSAAAIHVFLVEGGTVGEAVAAWESGSLEEARSATVQGNW
jgi:predicted Fe-Mo cluster-binding NifX family protein